MNTSPETGGTDWLRLFPDADYRLPMNLRPGDAARFWTPRADAAPVLAERRQWLQTHPQRHLQILPQGREATAEALEWLSAQTGLDLPDERAAAEKLEADFLVLGGDSEAIFPVWAGAVIFPSSWALEEKIGRPLAEVHAPVPGLESALGASIATFLGRIAPGAAWERENWGLSADPRLNQHPAIAIERLNAGAQLENTWLRLERQFLTRLPCTRALLFGIRVSNHRLDALAALPGVASRLARALETMPEPLAAYKGLDSARGGLVAALRAVS